MIRVNLSTGNTKPPDAKKRSSAPGDSGARSLPLRPSELSRTITTNLFGEMPFLTAEKSTAAVAVNPRINRRRKTPAHGT